MIFKIAELVFYVPGVFKGTVESMRKTLGGGGRVEESQSPILFTRIGAQLMERRARPKSHCLPDLQTRVGPHGGHCPWGLGVRDKEPGRPAWSETRK